MKRLILAAALGAATLTAAGSSFAQGYGAPQNYGPPPGPPVAAAPYGQPGYGDRDHMGGDRDRMGGGYGRGGEFWRGAPATPWERVQWLQQRIERGRADGSLSPREAMRAQRELDRTKAYARGMRHRYGQLRDVDRDYIQQRLDYVSKTIRWARHNGM